MKRLIYTILLALSATFVMSACNESTVAPPTVKNVQSQKAAEAANSISFTENAEIDNIKKRLQLTANPGLLGYIVLLNESGQPVMYSGVTGKVTSGGKRLTDPRQVVKVANGSGGYNMTMTDAPSDEGTYGGSGEYVFFWTPAGQYIQWNGKYLYSDKPFRLSVQPLVVAVESK